MMGQQMLRLMGAAILVAGALVCGSASATPVLFTFAGASFTAGSGYGQDASEKASDGATLLDVRFSTAAFVDQSFSLDLPSPNSNTFLYGTVDLEEPNAMSGILDSETNDLGVTAAFTFTSPSGTSQTLTAVGTAVAGSVSDSFADYNLTWTPIFVNFGTGGQFRIDLATLSFSNQGSQNLNGTITLLTLPQTNGGTVPEPTSVALLGLGLAGLALVLRRRAA